MKNQNIQGKLSCACVWSMPFKLHRLHQTVQKKHGSADLTPSTPSILQQQHLKQKDPQDQQTHFISQGLKKLQESLVNFKIEESTCGDLYVYTRKDEIFLLRLEEVYEIEASNSTNDSPVTSMPHESTNDSSSVGHAKPLNLSLKLNSGVSRRPSLAGADQEASKFNPNLSYGGRAHHPSGGSINSTMTVTGLTNNQLLHNALLNNTLTHIPANSSGSSQRPNPEYIRLSVYGLNEPDEEMKQDLCKNLQTELDYWLLLKMCNSIDKNTYKTTSAQHPDKITDEDLTFFKQICENYFDFEIPLPFIFNFHRTMREKFFFYIKQIFNSNFKAIDAPASANNSIFNTMSVSRNLAKSAFASSR